MEHGHAAAGVRCHDLPVEVERRNTARAEVLAPQLMAALGVVTRREEKQLERRLSRIGVHINLDVEFEQLGGRDAASTAFKKDRRVNIRISSRDLEGIRERALEEGIPYQTLIATILLKTMSGRLVIAARSDSL